MMYDHCIAEWDSGLKLHRLFLMTIVSFLYPTFAFDDLRGQKCRAPKIALDKVPINNVEWYGSMTLELVCDEGYDYPLNFNPEDSTNTITCRENDRWEPDFLPDCVVVKKPTERSICPAGRALVMTPKGKLCRGCPLGQYLDTSGSEPKCRPCAKGFYQDTPNSASCIKCPYLEEVTSKEIWNQVQQISINRHFHVLSCPIVQIYPNGSAAVYASPNQFKNTMKIVVKERERKPLLSANSDSSLRTRSSRLLASIAVTIILLL